MDDGTAQIEISLHPGIAGIDAADWDACACPETLDGGRPLDPFTTHRFLAALETSGSVGKGTGWLPRPLLAREQGRVIGALPMYEKHHSQGEYIFDWNWADAYERSGGRYYPKLQVAVPFTPVSGRRLLTRPGHELAGQALLAGAIQIATSAGVSSIHATFCTAAEAATGATMGLLHRHARQFHWHNPGYNDFDGFLATLSSRKRKAIRRERERAQAFGGSIRALTGAEIEPRHWDAFWQFYQDTGSRKWGRPYLTRAFFDRVQETMRDDVLLILAERNGKPVAGALNFIGRQALFGRYWGATEEHPFLHFECCYYQAIDWAIRHGLPRVEAGAQGEHKLARGYLPAETHSVHWLADPGFRRAVAKFIISEGRMVAEEMETLSDLGPFRKSEAR